MKSYSDLLKENGHNEVYFGCLGFTISNGEDIEDLQVGYSLKPDGKKIGILKRGGWRKKWLVIGNDAEVGDPFFIDTASKDLEVYTAMHGMGLWIPERVAKSLESFLAALEYLYSLGEQEHARISPDSKTITDLSELRRIGKRLVDITGEQEYWESFLVQYQDWLSDSVE
ncbi:hypothetical protein [Aliagarivorans marinus]|uniref:hypothetical protein n=1 Tax=Aliagarivorans marinus TaxID=561965 RepID=UPI00041A3B22|nr:hypothetical protein [Aliagarivorans marinus]